MWIIEYSVGSWKYKQKIVKRYYEQQFDLLLEFVAKYVT